MSGARAAASNATKTVSPATTIRKRKVQSSLKDRAEAFLANAATPASIMKTASTSKKRKIADLQNETPVKKDSNSKTAFPTTSKPISTSSTPKSRSTTKKKADGTPKEKEEKRLGIFRKQAPKTFLEKLSRAQTQRMIVIGRTRTGTADCPSEEIDIVGSTGNIYKVTVGQTCSCTCPDSLKGNECKHKVYALHTVLKAPQHLQYQLAFLSSELREIFAAAPTIPTESSSSNDSDGKRKPVEGECPICYMDFDEEHNELVWCKAACGNNMHKSCFDQWAASQRGQTVKCVYCRTPWEVDAGDVKELQQKGQVGPEGYVNVAQQFGMSGARDTSSYHQPWVRRNYYGIGY